MAPKTSALQMFKIPKVRNAASQLEYITPKQPCNAAAAEEEKKAKKVVHFQTEDKLCKVIFFNRDDILDEAAATAAAGSKESQPVSSPHWEDDSTLDLDVYDELSCQECWMAIGLFCNV